jgi:hypothetical protein
LTRSVDIAASPALPAGRDRANAPSSRLTLTTNGAAWTAFGATANPDAGFGGYSAQATEGGTSLYIPGLRSPLAGVVPPPGFYFENDFYSYSGKLSSSTRTQLGGAVLSNVKVEARIDFVTPTWVTPVEILGGNLAFAVSIPFGTPSISARAVLAGPRLRAPIGLSLRDSTFNIGDPVVSSFVGWHAGNLQVFRPGRLPPKFSMGLLNLSANRLRQIQDVARGRSDPHLTGERFSLVAECGLILLHLADPVDEASLLLQHGAELGDSREDFANSRERRHGTALS